jgi:hypothetical protein
MDDPVRDRLVAEAVETLAMRKIQHIMNPTSGSGQRLAEARQEVSHLIDEIQERLRG